MDALNKNIPINQVTYCDDNDPDTAMYTWMHLRSSGPNCIRDNIFCGENKFKEDVLIEGNLTVLGTFDPVGEVDIGLDELNDVELTGPLVDGQVLVYDGPSMMWVNGVPAGGGDVTNGNNVPVGPGAEVFRDKTAGVLNFRKLVGVTNTTVTQVGDTVEIGSTGDITGGANLGGGQEVFKNEAAGVLNFRTLVSGTNTVVTTVGDTVKVDAPNSTTMDLDDLTDVEITAPADKQFLQYQFSSSLWKNLFSALSDSSDVQVNLGLGNTTGDRLTYVKNNLQVGGYPFIMSPINWTNLSVISGAISFENSMVPLVVVIAGNDIPTLIPFVGVLQAGAFLVTTNGLGRLMNDDAFTWSFNINFSCSLTGGSNSEWTLELDIDGVKVSNPYNVTVNTNGKYVTVTGVWTQALRGSSVSGPPSSQYCEIYIIRRVGSSNVTINSAYLSITGVKLLDRP